MSMAFVVMQIGDSELDQLFDTVIQPATESAGLQAKRVDRHNEGGLLKSEIIEFLNNSDIIVADLTNERPNVYLEVGYAMGIDKLRNLILTCRSDHLPGNAGWQPDGPKIHFDLAGYDILLWEPSEPDSFRQQLEGRIRRRRALLSPVAQADRPVLDMDWVGAHRETASPGCGGRYHGLHGGIVRDRNPQTRPQSVGAIERGFGLQDSNLRLADRRDPGGCPRVSASA